MPPPEGPRTSITPPRWTAPEQTAVLAPALAPAPTLNDNPVNSNQKDIFPLFPLPDTRAGLETIRSLEYNLKPQDVAVRSCQN